MSAEGAVPPAHLDVRKTLQERLKKGGARWDPRIRLWRMRYDTALALGLRRRLLKSLPKPESGDR